MIDFKKFGARVRRQLGKTGISLRQIARDIPGQSLSTWSRAINGKPLSADAYLWFCRECSISPEWAYRHNALASKEQKE